MRDGQNDKQRQWLARFAGLKTMASLAMFPMSLANGTPSSRHYRHFSRLSHCLIDV